MRGIQFVVDARGNKVAVVIDLKRYGDVWEDFCDTLVARRRAHEPRESLAAVKARFRRAESESRNGAISSRNR